MKIGDNANIQAKDAENKITMQKCTPLKQTIAKMLWKEIKGPVLIKNLLAVTKIKPKKMATIPKKPMQSKCCCSVGAVADNDAAVNQDMLNSVEF